MIIVKRESCEVWNGHGCLAENVWKYGYGGEPGSLLGMYIILAIIGLSSKRWM